jgi:plastocyanin
VTGRAVYIGIALTFLLLAACATTASSAGPPAIERGPDDPSLPYGITAIDYHFHDAHPSIPLDPTRAVKWTNDGRVTHNVTIPEIGFSRDLPVGTTFLINDLGRKLGGPGTYTFFCKYHDIRGMTGVIVIAGSLASSSTSPSASPT